MYAKYTVFKSLSCDYHVTPHLQLKPVGAAMLADGAVMHLLDYLQFDCPDNHGSFVTVEALGRLAPKAGPLVSAHAVYMCITAGASPRLPMHHHHGSQHAQGTAFNLYIPRIVQVEVLSLHATPTCMPLVALTFCNLHRGYDHRCVATGMGVE